MSRRQQFWAAMFYSMVPSVIVGAITYPFTGPFSLLIALGVLGLGLDVCLNGSDRP